MEGFTFNTGPDLIFNAKKMEEATRMVDIGPVFGIACHSGKVEHGRWESRHEGVVQSPEDAQAWLDGEDVSLTRIYPTQP